MSRSKTPYAETWKGAPFCLAAFALWLIGSAVVSVFSGEVGTTGRIAIQHVTGIVLLAPLFLLHSKRLSGISLRGSASRRDYIVGVSVVVSLYAVSELIEWAQGIPLEPWLSFVTEASAPQLIIISFLVIFIAPISEELAFRHFLLAAMPYKRGALYAAATVVAGALVFMSLHSYAFWVTNALMFMLAVVFAVARIKTGGLLLPIVLHSTAGTIGLTIILLKS